jgi:hypothetical protein
MPRIITIPASPILRENVYIARAQLHHAKRAQTLLDETQHWAKKYIKQAEAEAENIHLQAFKHGYRDGLIAAIQALADYFKEGQTLSQRLKKKLEEHAQTLLSHALSHPDMALTLLTEWINAQKPKNTTTLSLTLPLTSRIPREMILDRLLLPWKKQIKIKYHQKTCFIIKHGDVIAEFDPDIFLQQAQQALMYKMSNISEDAYQLDQATFKQIQDAFTEHFNRHEQASDSSTPRTHLDDYQEE